MRSTARSGAPMSALSRSDSAAATFASSRYALAETAVCALMQNSHWFAFETNAAIKVGNSVRNEVGLYARRR